jgi:tetratricopeptide (TPR) repeat protein
MHPLWREGLQTMANQVLLPAEFTRLADWLARHGDVATATAVRLAADQTRDALSLLERTVMTSLLVRAPALLGNLLTAFPEALRPHGWWQIGQAHVERRQGDWQAAHERLGALSGHGDPAVSGLARALQAAIAMERGQPADAAAFLAALASLPDRAVHQRALIHYWLGLQWFVRLDCDQAESALHEALAAFRTVADAHGELRALTALGNVASNQGRLADGEARFRQALALHDRLGLPPDGLLRHNLAAYLAQAGRYKEALELLDQAVAIAVALGPLRDAVFSHRTRAVVLMYLGERAQARQESDRAMQTAERALDPFLLAEARFHAGEWHCRFGQASVAVALGQQALADLQAHGLEPRWYHRILLAEALLAAGEHTAAKAMMTALLDKAPHSGMGWWLARLQRGLAQACLALGDAAAAQAYRQSSEAGCAAHGYCLPPEGPAASEPVVAAHLTITCFGRFTIHGPAGDQQEEPLLGPKARLMLALLTLEPGGLLREDLLDELFHERGISHNALAMQVNRLRRALEPLLSVWPSGGAIIAHRGLYRLNPALRLACDWHAFAEAAHQAGEASGDAERVCLYQRLVDLYQGALLPEFSQSHRITLARSQAQRQWQQAHSWLQAYYMDQGEPARALDLADANLALDPVAEVTHCFKMVTYARLGMHNAADRQYRLLRRLLHEQLGVTPSRETASRARELGLEG